MNVREFIEQSIEGLRQQTAAHSATWLLGEEDTWSVDQGDGTITFAFSGGLVAKAPVQIIGTYNPREGTFLWGWNHPSVPEPLRTHAELAKEFGACNQVSQFTSRQVKCSEIEAWGFAAAAARLAKANGAYRADAGGPLVYMTFAKCGCTKENSDEQLQQILPFAACPHFRVDRSDRPCLPNTALFWYDHW